MTDQPPEDEYLLRARRREFLIEEFGPERTSFFKSTFAAAGGIIVTAIVCFVLLLILDAFDVIDIWRLSTAGPLVIPFTCLLAAYVFTIQYNSRLNRLFDQGPQFRGNEIDRLIELKKHDTTQYERAIESLISREPERRRLLVLLALVNAAFAGHELYTRSSWCFESPWVYFIFKVLWLVVSLLGLVSVLGESIAEQKQKAVRDVPETEA